MKYYPNSALQLKTATSSDNFVIKHTNKPYLGPYLLTSDGKTFAGTSFDPDNPQIVVSIVGSNDINEGSEFRFGRSKGVKKHTILKDYIYQSHKSLTTIPTSKPLPTQKDYDKGYFIRYYIKKVNEELDYKEIDKKTFEKISKKNSRYDTTLHRPYSFRWDLTQNSYEKNKKTLDKLVEDGQSYISLIFPILNEYQLPPSESKTNLSTKGGELYYENGEEYIGEYHIHPKKGPMEGPTHIKAYHAKLYYLDQLPSKGNKISDLDNDFERYLNKKRKEQLLSDRQEALKDDRQTTRNTGTTTGGRGTTGERGTSTSRGNTSTSSTGGGGGY